jgi:hypothetical protein
MCDYVKVESIKRDCAAVEATYNCAASRIISSARGFPPESRWEKMRENVLTSVHVMSMIYAYFEL